MRAWYVLVGTALGIIGCSSGQGGSGQKLGPGQGIGDGEIAGDPSGGGESAAPGAAGAPSAPSAGTASGGADSSGGAASSGNGTVPSGILTAGTWDDDRNYDLFGTYRAGEASLPGAPPLMPSELDQAHALWAQPPAAKALLDVSLVIDTTGSMGDEMAYLASEFLAMHAAIEARYPNAQQRWSLVVYKDVHDPYIVRWFDFRTDPNDFVKNLSAQTAGGGDDYPESPERALATTAQLAWRGDDTAKLAFWVTDAPHHDKDAAAMADALRALAGRGVHLYPVAASGADELTELTMREGAELTGGRFLFLTDDSGVGNSHEVPRVPCFFVTKLDAAILRMVDIEVTGKYREPDASEVIRTGGDPQSGRCTLDGGQTATVF